MNTLDSIPHATTMILTLAGSIIFCSSIVQADAPPPETFNKPADLVLTLSNDWSMAEDSELPQYQLNTPNRSNATKFITNKDKEGPLDMGCGMDVNPYADTDTSITSRLSGTCDLKYKY